MTRREAMDQLKPSLTAAIQDWMDDNCEKAAWESLDAYTGDDAAYFMSTAAMAVLGGIVDIQAWLQKEGDAVDLIEPPKTETNDEF